MLSGRKYLGEETDIWSLGIILYTLLCGGLPFDHDDEREMKDLILKGEYEEPEWLSNGKCHPSPRYIADCAEAKSLIHGMLELEPAQRLSIEGILSHPWFKMTLVDHLPHHDHSVPASPAASPNSQLPAPSSGYFAEPFKPGGPSRYLSPPVASPLSGEPVNAGPNPAQSESEPSETSFDFADSEHGRADTGVTTPTTTESEDHENAHRPPLPRTHSGDESYTEKALELLHSNTSQTTIKRAGSESPGGASGTVKSRVAIKSALAALEGPQEVDEDAMGDEEGTPHPLEKHASFDENSLHLPLIAQHSRTPSRTKRRSVSSTLSLERRHSHHSSSGQWQTYAPEDYVAQLNATPPSYFTSSSEKELLNRLSDLGVDIGQLKHSVERDACDSSAATWWMLRHKQEERGETDEVVDARNASAARRRERAAAYARDERRRAREGKSRDNSPPEPPEKDKDKIVTISREDGSQDRSGVPSVISMSPGGAASPLDLGIPVGAAEQHKSFPIVGPPDPAPSTNSPPLQQTTPDMDKPLPTATGLIPAIRHPDAFEPLKAPVTPPRDRAFTRDPSRTDLLSSPDASPSSKDRPSKSRSPSMSMLQRATSVLVGGRKTDDKDKAPAVPSIENSPPTPVHVQPQQDKRATSPSKLTKPPPKPKAAQPIAQMTKSDSGNTLNTLLSASMASPSTSTIGSRSPVPSVAEAGPSRSRSPVAPVGSHTPQSAPRLPVVAPGMGGIVDLSRPESPKPSPAGASRASAGPSSITASKVKASKRDSLWSTFRYMFAEDKRRRKSADDDGLPGIKVGPALVLARGPAARTPHAGRVAVPVSSSSRRASLDGRPPMYSRRSSSVNSRRSSITSAHLPEGLNVQHDHLPSLARRTSGRSHGSQTPTSDRETSRPSSLYDLPNRRHSSQSMRSPSVTSEVSGRLRYNTGPGSPLHNYQRRPPSGSASRRIKHIKAIPEGQMLRSGSVASVASSIRSATSSRASSRERHRDRDSHDSDYDTGGEAASLRSLRKRHSVDSGHHSLYGTGRHSLAQQIHRARSPLSASQAAQAERGRGRKKVLRDVFQRKDGDDEEWEDEEEEDAFAGGLGQGPHKNTSNAANYGKAVQSAWVGGMRAALHPNAQASAPVGKAGRSGKKQRHGADEWGAKDHGSENSGMSGGSGSGRRRGLPSLQPNAASIIEEEEEEE